MKLVYCHNRKQNILQPYQSGRWWIDPRGGSTVAMEAIQSWLLENLQMGDTIVRKIGIAKCSDEDNYCKKTGREIAKSRLKQTTLTVVNIVRLGTIQTVTVFFEDEKGNLFEVVKSNDPDCAILRRMLDD